MAITRTVIYWYRSSFVYNYNKSYVVIMKISIDTSSKIWMFVAVSLEQIRLDHIYAFVGSVQVVTNIRTAQISEPYASNICNLGTSLACDNHHLTSWTQYQYEYMHRQVQLETLRIANHVCSFAWSSCTLLSLSLLSQSQLACNEFASSLRLISRHFRRVPHTTPCGCRVIFGSRAVRELRLILT